jgi:hypothetical protein
MLVDGPPESPLPAPLEADDAIDTDALRATPVALPVPAVALTFEEVDPEASFAMPVPWALPAETAMAALGEDATPDPEAGLALTASEATPV